MFLIKIKNINNKYITELKKDAYWSVGPDHKRTARSFALEGPEGPGNLKRLCWGLTAPKDQQSQVIKKARGGAVLAKSSRRPRS